MTAQTSGTSRTLAQWVLPPLGLALWLGAVAVAGVEVRYSPPHLLLLATTWALFAATVWAGAALLRSLGILGGLAAAFLLGLTAVWQVRELTHLPGSLLAVAAIAALPTWPAWRFLLLPLGTGRWPRRLAATAAAAAALAALVAASWGSPVWRWHLLRHNTFLGTPLWYLIEPSVAERQQALLASRLASQGSAAAPAAAPATAALAAARPAAGDGSAAATAPPASPALGSPPATASPRANRPAGAATPPPNVVFVLLDTLRADALAAWGASEPAMPQLDAFLGGAYRFTDVWANASWTRPSMASFFTGLLPEEHAARDVDDALAERFVTLAERLKADGYSTAALVTNRAALGSGAGFAQGFDHYWELPGKPYARAEAVGRRVRQWLDGGGAAGPGPVFLYLHYLDPHTPYLAGDAPSRQTAAAYSAGYRRALAYLDGELASTLTQLAERLPGDTVFLVASDHGEQFFEHELFGHGHSLYQEVIHVPVALRWKGAGTGADLPQPLEARDFHDLLLAVAGGEVGATDVAAWSARRARPRRYSSVYYGTTGRLLLRPYQARVCMRAVEQDGYKLVWSAYGDTWELYDLGRDAAEQDNLAARFPRRVEALAAGLEEEVAFWSPAQALELEADVAEQMRALGYLD